MKGLFKKKQCGLASVVLDGTYKADTSLLCSDVLSGTELFRRVTDQDDRRIFLEDSNGRLFGSIPKSESILILKLLDTGYKLNYYVTSFSSDHEIITITVDVIWRKK